MGVKRKECISSPKYCQTSGIIMYVCAYIGMKDIIW